MHTRTDAHQGKEEYDIKFYIEKEYAIIAILEPRCKTVEGVYETR